MNHMLLNGSSKGLILITNGWIPCTKKGDQKAHKVTGLSFFLFCSASLPCPARVEIWLVKESQESRAIVYPWVWLGASFGPWAGKSLLPLVVDHDSILVDVGSLQLGEPTLCGFAGKPESKAPEQVARKNT